MTTMPDPVQAVCNWVNLDNYTSSEGFLGFFHRRSTLQEDLPGKAVDVLNRTLGMPDSLVSSLFVPANDEWLRTDYSLSELELHKLRELADDGIVRKVDFNAWGTDYASDAWLNCYRAACRLFTRISPVSPAQFLAVAEAMMVQPGLKGHLFAWYNERRLLVYPHDETGFGFIADPGGERQTLAMLAGRFSTAEFAFSVPPTRTGETAG